MTCTSSRAMQRQRPYIIGVCAILVCLMLLYSQGFHTTYEYSQPTPITTHQTAPRYMDPALCHVNCTTGVPCEYKDELDFRIIVITYNRPESLQKCLRHIAALDTLGDRVGVDIWVDRSNEGKIDEKTLDVTQAFRSTWKRGRACVHVQMSNANLMGQWVDTWRPREGTHELALILEDDIDISPLAYKWLKHISKHFHNWTDIAGYTLQMENVRNFKGKYTIASGPRSDPVFLHYVPNTWGFAPFPQHWRNFQDWFHEKRRDKSFHPYVPGIVPNTWYLKFIQQGTQDAMWSIWSIYYFYHHKLFTVCSNLIKYTGRKNVLLDTNRQEPGLHFVAGERKDNSINLMTSWDPSYVKFPAKVTRYGFDGVPLTNEAGQNKRNESSLGIQSRAVIVTKTTARSQITTNKDKT